LLEQIKILEPTLPLNILELGAGTGDSLSVLKETSNRLLNCYAIEPNPSMEESLQSNNIEVFRSYREAQEKQYDVLVAYEVVEHILDPITFLSEYGKLLRVGGLFVISTPNAHSIEVQLLKSESITLDIEHISVITPAAVHSLAARSGMKVLRIETPGEFDLELISKAENYANWGCGLTQNEVREFNFSSHMKIVLEKISD
jgi:SAM-dependent methyltransferase